jgi:tRNA(His) guanylyltransferase
LWQRRGIGVCWEEYEKRGRNPLTGEETVAVRRRLKVEQELPMKDAYSLFIRRLMQMAEEQSQKD